MEYEIYRPVKEYKKPQVKSSTLSKITIEYAALRKISQKTLDDWGIQEKDGNFVFRYFDENNQLVFVKYRPARKIEKGERKAWREKETKPILYGLWKVDKSKPLIITEGEFDCLSLLEAGYKAVLSVPNGAKSIDFIENCIDEIAGAEKVILAVDQDEPGYTMRNELARRIGIERCYKVDFGECKDANEYLIKYGAEKLREVIDSCEAFPIEGVFTSADLRDELDQLYFKGLPGGELIDIPEFDKLLAWQAGRVYTVTGIPGHGKSEFIDFVLTRLNILRGWKPGYFSPENWPIELHISKIVEKITGKRCNANDMPRNVFDEAVAYMEKNFYFILPEEDFTVDSILSRASGLVERKGINILVIDPYNRLEHKIPVGMSETHYISSFFDKIGNFAKRKNVMVILVAHPTKMKKES